MTVTGQISALYIYPVKSCRGVSLERVECLPSGLRFDREWVVVSTNGKVLTQRDSTKMALIEAHVSGDATLTLQAPGVSPLVVPPVQRHACSVPVDLWGNPRAGIDQGDEAAAWLSEFLEIECRLLRYDQDFSAPDEQQGAHNDGTALAFVDCSPLLVISEESLDDLNERLHEPVPMNRFRPSIVISGLGAFEEDRAKTLRVGSLTLYSAKPCARCVMTTIDQEKAVAAGPEPLRTLSKYRRDGDKVLFGHYFTPENAGFLTVGDQVLA
ncbi:MAG TPA: MOSC N-terminal beta barrel domain-containing protein [Candidatus Obscuribacterales bacterium]